MADKENLKIERPRWRKNAIDEIHKHYGKGLCFKDFGHISSDLW